MPVAPARHAGIEMRLPRKKVAHRRAAPVEPRALDAAQQSHRTSAAIHRAGLVEEHMRHHPLYQPLHAAFSQVVNMVHYALS
jgi:hypothetical protein